MESVEHKPPPYFIVWGVLFVLTVLEVFYAFSPIAKVWIAVGLIVMALWKAVLVALYYMHLRFEPRRLWVLAVSPIPLIFILLVVTLKEIY